MNKATPHSPEGSQGAAGTNHSSSLPLPRTTVNRLTLIQHKIRQSGLLLVDIAELAGLRFTTIYALMTLGLVSAPDSDRLETLFSGEVLYAL